MPKDEYMTIREMAAEFKVHPHTVRRAIWEGHIKTVRLSPNGAIRIPRSAVGLDGEKRKERG